MGRNRLVTGRCEDSVERRSESLGQMLLICPAGENGMDCCFGAFAVTL
jgi:hypothetical protein